MTRMRQRRHVIEERSAGGVIFRSTPEGIHVLLIKDAYKNWGLPKGHIEPSESPKVAAVREALEETGLVCEAVGEDLMTIDWYFKAEDKLIHKYCEFFLMENKTGDPVPEESEGISACQWFPIADAVREITYDNAREVLKKAVTVLADRGNEKDESK